MKFLITILLTALLGYAAPLFGIMPWWTFAITSLIIAVLIHQKAWKAFVAGFLGLFLLWGIQAFIIDSNNDHILSTRIASVLPFGGNTMLLLLVTAFVGGLVSGFAALTGSLARRQFARS
jgi:hypothetical protein